MSAEQLLLEYSRLEQILLAERQALIARDHSNLLQAIEAKQLLVDELAAAQAAHFVHSGQNPDDSAGGVKRDAVHTRIRELAATCQELNLVNGRLVQRGRHYTQELLRILQGTHSGPLYGADGTTATDATSSALTLA